jgi:hypothetical protein
MVFEAFDLIYGIEGGEEEGSKEDRPSSELFAQ